jgi:uncharacterized protein (TIRG00374 family)
MLFLGFLIVPLWAYQGKFIFSALYLQCRYLDLLFLFAASEVTSRIAMPLFGPMTKLYLIATVFELPYSMAICVLSLELFITYFLRIIVMVTGIIFIFGLKYFFIILLIFFTFFLIILVFKIVGNQMLFLKENKHLKKACNYLKILKETLTSPDKKKLFFACSINFSVCLLNTLILYVILRHFGHSYNFLLILFVHTIGLTVMIISQIPLGLGIWDLTILGMLIKINVDKTDALSSVLLLRIFTTVIPLIFSIIIGNILFKRYLLTYKTRE